MTEQERIDGLDRMFESWHKQCRENVLFPTLLICLVDKPGLHKHDSAVLFRGGEYKPDQVRVLLQAVIDSLPKD